MDPILCCALGLCCPPASVEQFDAVVTLMEQRYKNKRHAKKMALLAFPEFVKIGQAMLLATE